MFSASKLRGFVAVQRTMVCLPISSENISSTHRAVRAEAIHFYQFQKFNSMKTLSLTTLLTTLFVALGATLFAQNQYYSLDARIEVDGIEIQDMENPAINYTKVVYNRTQRTVTYEGFIGSEIVYETGTGEELIPLNTFTLEIEDHPHKNALTVGVVTAKGYKASLEARDYSYGFLGYRVLVDGTDIGEGQARRDDMPENVTILTEYEELLDGHDAFNILRFSPLEIKSINPFTLFASQPALSNNNLEIASAIESMEYKFLKWMGEDRGLGLANDNRAVHSTSVVCTLPTADNPEQDCSQSEDESDERSAFLQIRPAE